MPEQQESINRQSASHDASRIVAAKIERAQITSDEEIIEELEYWTAIFKKHADTGRWENWDKKDVLEMKEE